MCVCVGGGGVVRGLGSHMRMPQSYFVWCRFYSGNPIWHIQIILVGAMKILEKGRD